MAEEKQRSGIFKFFYVILSIITFPIFAIFFILRHPLWILLILLILAGGAYYYPISQEGIKPDEVIAWYQKKYNDVKIEMVNKALESGTTDYLPKTVLDDVKKIEEEAKEAQMPKSENYNDKVVRDSKGEETKIMIKKRGGFKKKNEDKEETNKPLETESESKVEMDVLSDGAISTGGLSSLLKHEDETSEGENPKEEIVNEPENEAVMPVVEPEESVEPEVVSEPKEPVIPEPVAEPQKPVIPESAPEPEKSVSDDDLELDLF